MKQEKEEIRGFFSNYAAQFIAFIANTVLGIIVFKKITTILGPELYGHYAIFGILMNLCSTFFIAWLTNSYMRFGREEFSTTGMTNTSFSNQVFLSTMMCGTIIIVIYIFRNQLSNYIGLKIEAIYMLMCFLVLFIATQALVTSFKIVGSFKKLALITPIQSGIFLAFIICLIENGSHAEVIILISLITQGLALLIISIAAPWSKVLPMRIEFKKMPDMLKFASASLLWIISYTIIDSIDALMIKEYLKISQVGIYNASYRIMSYVWMLPQLTITLTLNLIVGFTSLGRDDLVRIYAERHARQGIFIVALITVIVIVSSKEIFSLFLNNEYSSGILPFAILMLSVSLRSVNAFLSPIINAYLLLRQASVVIVIMAVFNIVGDLITLKMGMGLIGPAIITSIVFFIDCVGTTWITFKRVGINNMNHILFALYPIFAIPVVMITSLSLRIGYVIVLVSIMFLIAKRLHVFSLRDMTLISSIQLPNYVRKGLYRFCQVME